MPDPTRRDACSETEFTFLSTSGVALEGMERTSILHLSFHCSCLWLQASPNIISKYYSDPCLSDLVLRNSITALTLTAYKRMRYIFQNAVAATDSFRSLKWRPIFFGDLFSFSNSLNSQMGNQINIDFSPCSSRRHISSFFVTRCAERYHREASFRELHGFLILSSDEKRRRKFSPTAR